MCFIKDIKKHNKRNSNNNNKRKLKKSKKYKGEKTNQLQRDDTLLLVNCWAKCSMQGIVSRVLVVLINNLGGGNLIKANKGTATKTTIQGVKKYIVVTYTVWVRGDGCELSLASGALSC